MPQITAFYAAILTLLFVLLATRVIRMRRAARVSLGTGGDPELEARMRAQGNCAEYAPLGLLLLLLAELLGSHGVLLHLLGAMLVAGRVLHALALSAAPQRGNLRVAGMGLTLTMLGVGALVVAGRALTV